MSCMHAVGCADTHPSSSSSSSWVPGGRAHRQRQQLEGHLEFLAHGIVPQQHTVGHPLQQRRQAGPHHRQQRVRLGQQSRRALGSRSQGLTLQLGCVQEPAVDTSSTTQQYLGHIPLP